MSTISEEELIAAVSALQEDAVALLSGLVSCPSLLGDEESAQLYMEQLFKDLNDQQLSVERVYIRRVYLEASLSLTCRL